MVESQTPALRPKESHWLDIASLELRRSFRLTWRLRQHHPWLQPPLQVGSPLCCVFSGYARIQSRGQVSQLQFCLKLKLTTNLDIVGLVVSHLLVEEEKQIQIRWRSTLSSTQTIFLET